MADDVLLSMRQVATVGKPKATLVHLPSTTTLAAATTFAQSFTSLLEDVSDAYVAEAAVTFLLDISGQTKAAPDGATRSGDGARFLFDAAGRYGHGIWVPAFKPALLSDVDVLTDEQVVIDFIAAYVSGLGGTLPTDGHGEDLTAFLKARFAWRK
jgi:hypothetical protein